MKFLQIFLLAIFLAACTTDNRPTPIFATASEIDTDARASWQDFISTNDAARALNAEASAVLIFPNIIKGGFIAGGQYGDGVLIKGADTIDYYTSGAASYGLQAGVQRFGYALVFTNEGALDYLKRSSGWEIGIGPSVVVANDGLAGSLSSTTARADVYAFFFNQQGLMAGVSIEGTKISRRDRNK